MTESRVFRRQVFYIGGYDPAPPVAVFGRFARELRRFELAWSARTTISELEVGADLATWRVSASGSNWQTETEMNLIRWDDVILRSGEQSVWRRLVSGIGVFFDFVIAGALSGYLKSSWRYAGFFLYPFVVLTAIAALSLGAFWFSYSLSGSIIVGVLALAGVGLLLSYAADRWIYLGLLLDDWIFARKYIRDGDSLLSDRLQRVAVAIANEGPAKAGDELLIVGHSLGAVLAIDLIDRVAKIQGERGIAGPKLAFLSVGSSILKIGLHGGAREFREAIGRVSSNRDVFWADYRARSDVMNFYGARLLLDLRLPAADSPVVRDVSIRRMIAPERYPRIRRNWYKMHCQFVRGNDRRAPFDYFMAVCGPISAERCARLEQGAVDQFDADGRLIEPAGSSGEHKAVGAVKP